MKINKRMSQEKPVLFTPFKIGNLEIKNRIVLPPMTLFCAKDGFVNESHIQNYEQRAKGGAGLIIVEATGIQPYPVVTKQHLGIWDDKFIDGLSKLVKNAHDNDAKIGIQLIHSGRKVDSNDVKAFAPSPIPFDDKSPVPVEMTQKDIDDVIEAFVKAAERAVKAGFDLIQIHAAHGYLINQFLSPLTNKRTDDYGKNKAKFLEEILRKTREVVGKNYPIQVRLSGYDWKEGGCTPKYYIDLLKPLEKEKLFDSLDISSGGVVSDAKIIMYEGYQIPFAVEFKQHMDVPIVGGGFISDFRMANNIVKSGAVDAVFIGKEFIKNPFWGVQASYALGNGLLLPKDYLPIKGFFH